MNTWAIGVNADGYLVGCSTPANFTINPVRKNQIYSGDRIYLSHGGKPCKIQPDTRVKCCDSVQGPNMFMKMFQGVADSENYRFKKQNELVKLTIRDGEVFSIDSEGAFMKYVKTVDPRFKGFFLKTICE